MGIEEKMRLDDILFLLILSIFLIILYQTIVQKRRWTIIDTLKDKYIGFNKKNRTENYIRLINTRPADKQKIIFENICILTIVVSIMFLFVTKSIFFVAVASESMSPTLNKYDIVLMQNINRDYKIGDIIIFENPNTAIPVTHRIKSITNEGIQTMGDAVGKTDWWQLKKEDIIGKAILIGEKPIIINKFGRYFIAEERGQTFGPFDYRTYFVFFDTIKLYGYIIAIICILTYIALEIKRIKTIR